MTTTRSCNRRKHYPHGRRLIVVDIENVVGGGCTSLKQVLWARELLEDMVMFGQSDHVVIGTSHVGLLEIACNWVSVRYVVRSGADGADLALLEVLEEDVAERFDDVVLISGDGIFAESIARLGDKGVQVTVIAHPEGLSRRLGVAAAHVRNLPRHFPQSGDPAEARLSGSVAA